MLLLVSGCTFTKDAIVSNKDETGSNHVKTVYFNPNGVSMPPLNVPETIILPHELTIVSDTIEVNNLQRTVTISRDFSAVETIPGSINYTDENDPQGKWEGTLYRAGSPTIVPLPDNGMRVYYTGSLDKEID
jgi:hypothetical protein